MLCCGSAASPENKEQKKGTKQIDDMIAQEKRKFRTTHRLLLLGKVCLGMRLLGMMVLGMMLLGKIFPR